MHIIGLTGGIGAGKSYVLQVFKAMDIPTFCADIEAKNITDTVSEIKKKIQDTFGSDMYSFGSLNRNALAEIVFSNTEQLQKLNNIIHPFLKQKILSWQKTYSTYTYGILEAAILFENNFDAITKKNILVTAPYNERIRRVIKRDNTTVEGIEQRIKHQYSQEKLQLMADYIIDNSKNNALLPQILSIHKKILTINA